MGETRIAAFGVSVQVALIAVFAAALVGGFPGFLLFAAGLNGGFVLQFFDAAFGEGDVLAFGVLGEISIKVVFVVAALDCSTIFFF